MAVSCPCFVKPSPSNNKMRVTATMTRTVSPTIVQTAPGGVRRGGIRDRMFPSCPGRGCFYPSSTGCVCRILLAAVEFADGKACRAYGDDRRGDRVGRTESGLGQTQAGDREQRCRGADDRDVRVDSQRLARHARSHLVFATGDDREDDDRGGGYGE